MPDQKLYQYPYGFVSQKIYTELELELYLFLHHNSARDDGAPDRKRHFKRVTDILWPEKSTAPFIWHPWAEQMLDNALEHNFLGLIGCASSGKCLAPKTNVLLYNGTVKPAMEIVPGDVLMGDDSTPRHVLTTSRGRSNMVRIVPEKGDPWECNDDHILTLKRAWSGERSRHRVGEICDLSVKAYQATTATFKRQRKLFCVGVEFPYKPVEFDPHVYGIWLGDGTTGRPHITSHDSEKEVNEFITSYFKSIGYEVKKAIYSGRCPTYMITKPGVPKSRFFDFVRESSCGTNGQKRILPIYLRNCRKIRMEVLAGIIDADGYGSSTYYEISCSYPELSDDIVYLARSLGFRVTVKHRVVRCNGKSFKCNRICILGDVDEIPTLRKKCRRKKIRTNSDCTSFRINNLGIGDWCGFTIDGNGRFLLGDFTVTHNTDFGAVWAIVNWLAAPLDTLVLVTSTSLKDSRKRIWGSITSYFQKSAVKLPGKLVDSMGIIRTERGTGYYNDKEGIAMIAGEKKKEKEAIGKMIGMKNKRVIMIADELPELSPAILEAAFTNLTSNPFFQLIGIGNFASMFDPLGEFVAPKLGYSSISPNDSEWETKRGYCVRFDGLKSPNITGGEDKWPIYNSKMLARHRAALGENTIGFWRMVRSFPCPEGGQDTIYSEPDFIHGGCNDRVTWLEPPIPVAGLDPAFTNGGDNCVLYLGNYGIDINMVKIIQFDQYYLLREDITKTDQPRNFQIARKFMETCVKAGVQPQHAALDATGAGAVFYDIVCQTWSNKVLAVNFGGKASQRPVSVSDWRPCEDHYANRVSELWFAGLEFMKSGQIKGVCFDLASQMKARKYTTVKGVSMRVQVEPKRDMKERVGWSPDIADAGFVLIELCRERLNAIAGTKTSGYVQAESAWDDQVKQSNRIYEDLDYSEQPLDTLAYAGDY